MRKPRNQRLDGSDVTVTMSARRGVAKARRPAVHVLEVRFHPAAKRLLDKVAAKLERVRGAPPSKQIAVLRRCVLALAELLVERSLEFVDRGVRNAPVVARKPNRRAARRAGR